MFKKIATTLNICLKTEFHSVGQLKPFSALSNLLNWVENFFETTKTFLS